MTIDFVKEINFRKVSEVERRYVMRKRSFLYGVLIMILLLSSSIFAIASNKTQPSHGEIYLYTGSPLILSNGEVEMLDSTNPDLGATVVQSRTLLPLRALSEYFGAEVNYDQTKREAIIKYDGIQYHFPIGQKKYIVESTLSQKEYAMDSQSVLIDGRTMVPLRVICENVLGRKVSYYDRVIAVADKEISLQTDTALVKDVRGKIGEAVKANSMKELQLALAGANEIRTLAEDTTGLSPTVSNEKSNSTDSATAAESGSSYSTTNTQVNGIDEADVVKTDGKYIYIAGNNVVRIVGADQGKLSDETTIRLASNKNVSEIYVDDNRLVILGTKWFDAYKNNVSDTVSDEKMIGIMPPYYPTKNYSFMDVYDITDPLKPTFVKGHEMEGSYQSSRKNGEIVYLVTNTYLSVDILLPMMRDTVIGNDEFSMELNDVMIMPRHPSSGYTVISAMNINNEEKTEVEAITAYGSIMYMNESALYLAVNDSSDTTSIIKFKLEGTKIGYAGSGNVKGYLLNQFSMDEYEGNLRVATTSWQKGNENGLYVLNNSLNVIGSVEGLAKGETIYSVRFIGDKGYIVTYRNMDPLFVFDLSNPEKPMKTGELEMPGFSNYLHPIGKDLILGIGADTYNIYRKDDSGNEIVVGTRQGGIKFSLFDISDSGRPKEISKYVLGDSGSSSEAFYNHKAIMVDEASTKVSIDANIVYEDQNKGYQQGAVIMGFEGNKLALKGILDSKPSGVYGNNIPYARRILYIGDELYYVQDGRITSYDYDSLKQIDNLVLQ